MTIKSLLGRSLAVVLAISFVVPVRAAGYERYRKVISPSGNETFYKNIPIKDFFKTPGTVTPNAGAGGGAVVKSMDAVAIGSKGTVTATATGIATAVDILGVAKAISGGPIGIAVFAIPLIADWLLSNGARARPAGSAPPFEVKSTETCTVDPCVQFRFDSNGVFGPWSTSAEGATRAALPLFPTENGKYSYQYRSCVVDGYNTNCTYTVTKRNIINEGSPNQTYEYVTYVEAGAIAKKNVPATPGDVWVPAEYPQVEARIIDKPVPTAVVEQLDQQGGSLPISYAPGSGFVPVDGPASIDAPPVVTSSTSGDTTTKTTSQDKTSLKYDLAPDPETGKLVPRVTASTTNASTTTSTNNVTGETTTTNTTTQTKPDTTQPPPTDIPLPDQPKLYKQKYPEGITGVWQKQRDLLANSPLFTLAKKLMPTVGLSGSCPTMPVNLNVASWANFGVKDVAPPCQVWDWGRAICIVSACLLARRLIFGA